MKILEETEYGIRIKTNDGHIITYPQYDPLHTENLIPKLTEFAKSHDDLMRRIKEAADNDEDFT